MDTEIQPSPASPEVLPTQDRDDLVDVQQQDVDKLPADAPGDWHIELRYLPVVHRAHAFLALVDPSGKTQRELHGLSRSRNTDKLMTMGIDGSHLVGVQPRSDRYFRGRTTPISTVYTGSYDEAVRGGEIQNSNSANFTFGKPMHLDLGSEIRNKGLGRKFPGWGRDLLDPTYRPYVASTFPHTDTP